METKPMQQPKVVEDYLSDKFKPDQNNLHLIRLIAAIAVIYGHSYAVTMEGGADFINRNLGFGFTGGLAVDAFFVISGFLVTASVMKGDWIFFITSRALRIFPALWACLLLTAFVFGPLLATGPYDWSAALDYFWRLATLQQFMLFIPGLFTGLRDQAVNGVLWSVLIEAEMYFWTLVLFASGILRRRAIFNTLFFMTLVAGYFSPGGVVLGYGATDRHVMLLYVIGAFFWINRDIIRINSIGICLCILLGALTQGTPKFEYAYLLILPYLVFSLATGLKIPWFDNVDYSYGVYLWGWPIQQSILLLYPAMTVVENQLIAIPLALFAGAASWHFIERPALRHKRAVSERIRSPFRAKPLAQTVP
ncbi:acyltransferase [Aureimonas fodinaquatilis]|uniref:Acyltransferase n=1 Tax=Aureimonas fodinaquatilis TaxID=2565783 RepID=A0A5B0DVW5_9HYPH|nr:acyltransferase [Aureimonas fodinaquatilis]KAA0970977.1 acyltransferase [Aureimonas fodinaquatilis]